MCGTAVHPSQLYIQLGALCLGHFAVSVRRKDQWPSEYIVKYGPYGHRGTSMGFCAPPTGGTTGRTPDEALICQASSVKVMVDINRLRKLWQNDRQPRITLLDRYGRHGYERAEFV